MSSERILLSSNNDQPPKGWRSKMVSSLSGPVEMISIGAPTSSSMRAIYARAVSGSASSDLRPTVESLQPGASRKPVAGSRSRPHRLGSNSLARIVGIADADRNLVQSIEHVEFGQTQT